MDVDPPHTSMVHTSDATVCINTDMRAAARPTHGRRRRSSAAPCSALLANPGRARGGVVRRTLRGRGRSGTAIATGWATTDGKGAALPVASEFLGDVGGGAAN